MLARHCSLLTMRCSVCETGNFFSNSKPKRNSTFVLDESAGTFTGLTDSIVENNLVEVGTPKLGARATKTLILQESESSGFLNFTDALIFGPVIGIDHNSVLCSVLGRNALSVSAAVMEDALVLGVYVVPAVPSGVTVRITCSVDQSARLNSAH